MTILKYFQTSENKSIIPVEMHTYDIFTDGSEIKHKKTYKTLSVAWAYIINLNREMITSNSDNILDLKEGNNQRAELVAIYKALNDVFILTVSNSNRDVIVNNSIEINIYSDSDYAIKCFTVWSLNWKRNGWKTANKKPVKHKDIIEPCINLINEIKRKGHLISFHHVRAHTNKTDYISRGNNSVDILAQSTARSMLN